MEGIPPQPAPSAVPLAAYDTISPADIDLSMTPLEVSQPKAETTGSLQSSSTAQTEAGQLRDASNQAEQLLIKAALKTGGLLPSQEGNGIRLEKGDIAGPQLRHVAFEQPLATQPISGVVASQAHDEWTVIQSDGSDTEYNSRSGAKQGLVRVKSALPQEELPQQLQGLGLLHTGPSRGPAGVKTLTDDSSQLFKSKLPALKVPLTGMGRPRVAARRGTPRFVAEGSEDISFDFSCSRGSSLVCSDLIADAAGDAQMLMLQSYLNAQPAEAQEEEAAYALRQHLSVAGHMLSSNSSAVLLQASSTSVPGSTAQHAHCGNTAGPGVRSLPVAEGTEGRNSIAAFNPSWHLRANQAAQAEEHPSTQTADTVSDAEDSLDRFYRPAGGLPSKPPQHQPSMVEQAGCLNFGSHVVAKGQVAETQWGQSIGRKSKPRERSALDDAALSSEDSESEYEDDDEPRAQTQAHFEADNDAESASQSRMTSHDSQEHPAEGQYTDALPGQGQYEAGQYADYRSEEGQSEEGQYGEGHFDDTGLDQSLDVLPAGIISAPAVYSPMSCGAARVRSMITNRPFMLEEPMSPVAERRGATMRRGSQLALTAPAESLGSSVVAQGPQQQEEPLYRDWSQPVVQDLSATAAEPAAPAPMSEADLAAELAIADAMRKKGKKSDADAVKTGAIRKLTGSLFKRSGKKTAETQTTEYREEETQTSDQPEPPTEVVSQELVTAAGHPELGQELSFGDALKAQTAPPATEPHYGDLVLSDLLEAHGPLAMTAMSSPTHTSAIVLPSEQTSPAQLAGLSDVSDQDLPSQIMTQHSSEPLLQQPALTGLLAEAAPAGAGDMMTFQVDGQIKLGLRPRQLTFSASAQPPPQLWLQSQAGSQALDQSPFAAAQSAATLPLAEQPAGTSTHSSGASASGHLPDGVTASQSLDRSLQSAQPGSVSLVLQPQVSTVATAAPVAAPMSRQPFILADDMSTAVEAQCGQELTTVAPSLSWPGPATAAAAPSRQNSAAAPLLSRQPSAAVRPPSRQLSSAVQLPSRQASAAVPPLSWQPSAVGLPPSRQTSAVAAPHSRQSSGMPLPLSKQSSAVVPPPPTLSRQPSTSAEPHQAAGPSPRQGLEQAWAALLPSLLAEANRQGGDVAAAVPAAARLPAGSQSRAEAAAPVQTIGDILKLWAPVPKAMTAGRDFPHLPVSAVSSSLCHSTWTCNTLSSDKQPMMV